MRSSYSTARHPLLFLSGLLLAWKAFLLLVALASPGPGYDTSTSLMSPQNLPLGFGETPQSLRPGIMKLVRWDAIYFTHMSTQGRIFEQEWAFGMGLSGPVSLCVDLVRNYTETDPMIIATVVAITFSHIAHWLSVLTLFALTEIVFRNNSNHNATLPLVTSILHIVSPAGLFLSAPYTEAPFSLLNMFGALLYSMAIMKRSQNELNIGNLYTLLSGFVYAASAIVRSNGILSGLPFLYDAVLVGAGMLRFGPDRRSLSKLLSLVLGGFMIGVGFTIPQYRAYNEYCTSTLDAAHRPWCEEVVPSIYTFVQEHYWNVGLFRYWTTSNVPLFLLALPALSLLLQSAISMCWKIWQTGVAGAENPLGPSQVSSSNEYIIRLAMPQALLGILALTSYHVQIITRLSSGYALWYMWLARRLLALSVVESEEYSMANQVIIRWMVIYGVVQAGLFASFLPPA